MGVELDIYKFSIVYTFKPNNAAMLVPTPKPQSTRVARCTIYKMWR